MHLPDWTAVEFLQRSRARRHVGEAAEPDETIGIVHVAKLPNDSDAGGFLGPDEFLFEKIDQHVAHAWLQRVLPKLHHRATGAPAHGIFVKSMVQLVSQVWPASAENACSQCGVFDITCVQRKRTRIGFPLNVSSA